MKNLELLIFIGFGIFGMIGQLAVLVLHWDPGPHMTAAVAFTALLFASSGGYWRARRDRIAPDS